MSKDLICKFCGKSFSTGLCYHSPTKKHIAISDGVHCIFCGQRFSPGGLCNLSPTKKHQLQS